MTNAIFIGASNVVPGTWPDKLCALEGWTMRNYADSGTYWGWQFNPFVDQLTTAIADPAFDNADVGYVFVAGGGNDIRQYRSVLSPARSFHSRAKSAFPNARIISIPALWNAWGVHPHLTSVANEMATAAKAYGHEVIWNGWTWLIGHPEWMDGSVHPNNLGYDQFVLRIRNYLHGGPVTVNYPDKWTLPTGVKPHSRGIVQCVCVNGVVYLTARLVKTSGVFKRGDTVMTLPQWAAASKSSNPRPIAGGLTSNDRAAGFYVYSDGKVTVRTAGSGESEINIAMASWPLGM